MPCLQGHLMLEITAYSNALIYADQVLPYTSSWFPVNKVQLLQTSNLNTVEVANNW